MAKLLQQLHQDHINTAVLLDSLEEQARVLKKGGSPNFRLMYDIMHYMVSDPDAVHHPREDLIFDKLKDKDREIGESVNQLLEEHKKLAAYGQQLADALYVALAGGVISVDKVMRFAEDYLTLVRSHMDREEGKVFPKARGLLNDDDWREIESRLHATDDPVFGGAVERRYRELHECIQRDL